LKKKISSILIIIGVFIMAYPKVSDIYNDHKQQKITQQWEEVGSILEEDDEHIVEEKQEKVQKVESQEKKSSKNDKNNIEGILEIEKINLKLPVLLGATRENLKISLASVDYTGKPGQIGNYVIAGHRSRTYGRNFNRLDELEAGDIIEMNVGKNKYRYTVVDKLLYND
jgi:sortase A